MHACPLFALAMLASAIPLGAQDAPTPIDSAHGRIVISFGEAVPDTTRAPQIVLDVGTEGRYPCLLPLAARVARLDGAVVLDRWHIPPTTVCPSALGPARGRIPLGLGEGSHLLVIRHLGSEDRYRVTITGDAIRVVPPDAMPTRASILRDTLVWRVPRHSFAVGCGTTEFDAWMCAELFRLLAGEPGIRPIDIPRTGRDPYGDRDGAFGHWHNAPTRYFLADSPASYARVRRDVQRFYDEQVGRRLGHTVRIVRWTGEQWSTRQAADGERR